MSKRLALITGASRGIGEATMKLFAAKGFHVVGMARNESRLAEVCDAIREKDGEASYLVGDLARPSHARKLARDAIKTFGSPEVVVFNAAWSANRDFRKSTMKARSDEISLNYLSPCAMLDILIPAAERRGRGSFIAVGSLSSISSFPGNATYAASKASINSLWRSLDHEYRQQKRLRFGLVLPGLTETSMTEGMKTVLPRRSPDSIARLIYRTWKDPGFSRTVGLENQLALALARYAPDTMHRLVGLAQGLLVPRHQG